MALTRLKRRKAKGSKQADGKVFGLFRHGATIAETVQKFMEMLPKLKVHVFTAYSQWNAHAMHHNALDDISVMTIEDYQQNLELEYSENPTSMAYSKNKTTVALYPIAVEYKVNRMLHKGAIVFLSDDKLHDFQQMSAFEQRMFQILRAEIPHEINHWERWIDGCGHEFRSRYCNAELHNSEEKFQLESVK